MNFRPLSHLCRITLISACVFVQSTQAQNPIKFDAESGNKLIDQMNCWNIQNAIYSNLMPIQGNWSLAGKEWNEKQHETITLKTPWIRPNGNVLSFKIRSVSAQLLRANCLLKIITGNGKTENILSEDNISTAIRTNGEQIIPISVHLPERFKELSSAKIQISFQYESGSGFLLIDDFRFPGLYSADPSANCSILNNPGDIDNDGVRNDQDQFPNDPSKAFTTHFPVQGKGTLMFEDLWPTKGDYDMNDLVVTYAYDLISDAQNRITEIRFLFQVKNINKLHSNAFAFQLNGIQSNQIQQIRYSNADLTDAFFETNPNNTESNQTWANIPVFSNSLKQSKNPIIVQIQFTNNARINPVFASQINDQTFNPYIIVGKDRGHEIHLPDYIPSQKMNTSYFGQGDDNSIPSQQIYFKSLSNLPWALNIASEVPFMQENTDILKGYPNLIRWAESHGMYYSNWYFNDSENRNSEFLIQNND